MGHSVKIKAIQDWNKTTTKNQFHSDLLLNKVNTLDLSLHLSRHGTTYPILNHLC